MKIIRTFTRKGLEEVSSKIEAITSGKMVKGGHGVIVTEEELNEIMELAKSDDLLEAESNFNSLVEIDESLTFNTSFELAKYLFSKTNGIDTIQFEKDGTWTWIAVLYLDQLLNSNKNGEKLIGDVVRYVLREENTLRYYRHLIYMPHLIYSKHGEHSKIAINSPLYVSGEFISQAQKPILLSNISLIQMLNRYFYDETTGKFTKGFNSPSPQAPGSLRRLVQVSLLQMMVNFDLIECEPDRIFDLLPDDFKKVAFDN